MRMILNKNGSVLSYTVIILGVVSIVAFTASATAGINVVAGAYSQTQSVLARHELLGCVDETLFQMKLDTEYNPGTVTVGDVDCTMVMTDTSLTSKDFDFSRTRGNITRRMHVEISLIPVVVTKVTEE